MKRASAETVPPSSRTPQQLGFSFQEDLWFGDFDDDAARQAAANSMAAMAGRIMGARPFPAAAQRLVQLTRNEDTNIQKVVRVLESDPGLSQRVLRLVNSAGYGLRVRCTSLNHATALLGQQRLQQIATSAVLLNHFGRTSEETRRKQEHGALVASLCRYLAIHLGLPQEDLFTCGLLHDLGQLMMLDEGTNEYRELVRMHEEQWDALHISEREIMGFDHAVLAAHVLASWSIPAPVPEVIALHHQPALAHQRGSKIAAMVQTLRFADHMSHLLEHSSEAQGSKVLADSEAASYLGFSEMQIAAMWKDLRQLHEANRTRRMDIQDVAPRSVSVPASMSPRAVPFTNPPDNYEPPSVTTPPRSHAAPNTPLPAQAAVNQSPNYSDPPPVTMNSIRPEVEPPPSSVRVSSAPLSARSELEVLRLSEATPIVRAQHYAEKPTTPEEYFEHEASARHFDKLRFEANDEDDERPSVVGAEPEVFPCALCYGPTFGAQCPVCAAHVCTAHQTTEREWCMACDDEFHRFGREHEIGGFVRIASGTAMGVSVFSSALLGGWELGFGVLGICLATALAGYAGYQGYLKARFKRDRAPVDDSPPTLHTPSFVEQRRILPGGRAVERAYRSAPKAGEANDLREEQEALRQTIPLQNNISPTITEQSMSDAYSLSSAPQVNVSNVLHLGNVAENAYDEDDASARHRAVTIPSPNDAPAHEREDHLGFGPIEPIRNFSWPPSQDAPSTSHRTSFLPRPTVANVPLVSLSEPPQPLESDEEQMELPLRAIAPPSLREEVGDDLFIPESKVPYYSSPPQAHYEKEPHHRSSDVSTSSSRSSRASTNEFTMDPVTSEASETDVASNSPENEAIPEDHVLAAQSQHHPHLSELHTEPLLCQPALHGTVVITPPVIHVQMEFCTAPTGTVKILPRELIGGAAAYAPENDQNSQQASGER